MHHSALDTCLRFELGWNDSDAFQIGAAAWNRQFGGAVEVGAPAGAMADAAARLEGFPTNPQTPGRSALLFARVEGTTLVKFVTELRDQAARVLHCFELPLERS